ncbi:glutathione-dependent formaldehyde-activating enzyme [Colletotrichum truncatum]|uniref:Glutathione-dependent formaldehyde-activating enzyme n=1 Tax=Colletotrichum truncatum TaxID=5467 RepID=A0ACC3ZAF5_COLTU|nr:glutathione-dependent formaldehyde-activating enzyme [Colletotrichum truncatum]KAF6796225.1 glutathione-dependent formaldehyde-activating enzyme [Colletotrichum truncatum]
MSADKASSEPSKTYDGSCHCGNINFSLTLSPPLEEGYKVLECNCSICRRSGYLLIYPEKKDVVWHDGSRERCSNYRFNTKTKDQMFCGKCGSSLGIDFHNETYYGLSARALNGIDLDKLTYKKLDGVNKVFPAQDLSGEESKQAST